jgi:hypothetical protein
MTFYSKVEDIFTIPGRGCVIVPATPSLDLDFRLHANDPIQLRNPNGEVFDTRIVAIELAKPVKGACRMAFMLPKEIAKSNAPTGTEIWLENSK